jgi:hypothetical protein
VRPLSLAVSWILAVSLPASAQPGAVASFRHADVGVPPAPWRLETLPKLPRHTRFEVADLEGGRVLKVSAERSYANLLHPVAAPAGSLRWRWRLERQDEGTDLTRKDGDDVPARLCALFDVPAERLSASERWKLRLGRALFDPQLPAAAICYVWDARLAAGTWLPNAHTDRVQMLVLRSAASGHALGRWFDEARDLRADFARAFPRESAGGPVPLAAIAISADGDNTGAASVAYFGDVALEPALP